MNVYDNIYKIYFINMKKRTDRYNYIISLLNKYFENIPIERFEAIEPDDTYSYNFIKNKMDNSNNIIYKHPGIIGCYASHLCLLKKIYHEHMPGKFILIFEDDTEFNDTFINQLKLPLTIDNWNILLGINPSCNITKNNINSLDDFKDKHIFGTNVVIYNINNIDFIYKKILNIDKIYDYDFMLKDNIPNIYFYNTDYIKENKLTKKSDIREREVNLQNYIKEFLR